MLSSNRSISTGNGLMNTKISWEPIRWMKLTVTTALKRKTTNSKTCYRARFRETRSWSKSLDPRSMIGKNLAIFLSNRPIATSLEKVLLNACHSKLPRPFKGQIQAIKSQEIKRKGRHKSNTWSLAFQAIVTSKTCWIAASKSPKFKSHRRVFTLSLMLVMMSYYLVERSDLCVNEIMN